MQVQVQVPPPRRGRTNTQHQHQHPDHPLLVVASCVRAPKVEKTQTRGAYRHKRTRSINRKWSHTSVERYWKTSTTARPAPRATTRSSPQESEGTHHPPAACARAKMSNSVCDHLTLMHMALIDNPEMVAHLETQSCDRACVRVCAPRPTPTPTPRAHPDTHTPHHTHQRRPDAFRTPALCFAAVRPFAARTSARLQARVEDRTSIAHTARAHSHRNTFCD